MREISKFVANDGAEFSDEAACLDHETDLRGAALQAFLEQKFPKCFNRLAGIQELINLAGDASACRAFALRLLSLTND